MEKGCWSGRPKILELRVLGDWNFSTKFFFFKKNKKEEGRAGCSSRPASPL